MTTLSRHAGRGALTSGVVTVVIGTMGARKTVAATWIIASWTYTGCEKNNCMLMHIGEGVSESEKEGVERRKGRGGGRGKREEGEKR